MGSIPLLDGVDYNNRIVAIIEQLRRNK